MLNSKEDTQLSKLHIISQRIYLLSEDESHKTLYVNTEIKWYCNKFKLNFKKIQLKNQKSFLANAKNRKKYFTSYQDGTYDFQTGLPVHFDQGYQVSFETAFDCYTNEEYNNLVQKFDILSNGNTHIGVYNSSPEISFFFKDLKLAKTISIVFNQFSIWNWNTNSEIKNPYYKELKQ